MRFLMAKLPSRLTDRMAGTMITLGNSVTTARWRATVRPTTKITNDVSVRATKRLPITSPFSWKTSGPGTTPKMIITPRKTAAPTLPGIPSAIVHTRSLGMRRSSLGRAPREQPGRALSHRRKHTDEEADGSGPRDRPGRLEVRDDALPESSRQPPDPRDGAVALGQDDRLRDGEESDEGLDERHTVLDGIPA